MNFNAPKEQLRHKIANGAVSPLVYTYPPRSAYTREEAPRSIREAWADDLQYSPHELNLYIHIPFCPYRCTFCNLYTITGARDEDIAAYSRAVAKQIQRSSEIIRSRKLRTINIGGGTPTMFQVADFARIFEALTAVYPNWRSLVEEVSIEASPDTLSGPHAAEYLSDLRGFGVNRINIGIQSLVSRELRKAGRARAGATIVEAAIGAVRTAGIENLSTDLIIGLPEQTDISWTSTIDRLLELRPETISTYFLTIRPNSGIQRANTSVEVDESAWSRRYEYARRSLIASGYVRDSNVRYKLPGVGGLRQKVLQFKGIPVLGIGAGARSYNNSSDYIVGGHFRPALSQIREYLAIADYDQIPPEAGFKFNDEERIRKRLALDLFDLQLVELDKYDYGAYRHIFDPLLSAGVEVGLLCEIAPSHYQLTSDGFRHRDTLSRLFFSNRVNIHNSRFYKNIKDEMAMRRSVNVKDETTDTEKAVRAERAATL